MASATNTAAQEIETRLGDNWNTTPIAWPGVHFDPGEDEWVRPTIIWGASDEWTMGGTGAGKNIVTGILTVDVFARTGKGYGVIRGYADTLRDLFDRRDVGSVQFRSASGPDAITEEDTGWIGVQVTIPFVLEETT